jgi:two-component system cell cycle response regulator
VPAERGSATLSPPGNAAPTIVLEADATKGCAEMKILVAEDSATSRLLLERELTLWGYDVIEAKDGTEAWKVLQRDDAPRLVILDWMMPGLDGVDICELVRERDTEQPPYIILLTALGDKQDLVTGLRAGADDFLHKPFNSDELRARLEVGRRFVELYERLADAQRRLEAQAHTDALTGVPNRRAILERLEIESAAAGFSGAKLSVGLFDVDWFKRVNDTYGHAAGDAVLQQMTERVMGMLTAGDMLGRVGGEEFLIVMPGAGEVQALSFLEHVRVAIEATPFAIEDGEITVTVSVGGVTGRDQRADELIAWADTALYEAKERGRNRVVATHYGDANWSMRHLKRAV